MLMPVAVRSLHQSDPGRYGAAVGPAAGQPAAGEQLDANDRAELNRLIRSKAR
jgi:hypothetical protein